MCWSVPSAYTAFVICAASAGLTWRFDRRLALWEFLIGCVQLSELALWYDVDHGRGDCSAVNRVATGSLVVFICLLHMVWCVSLRHGLCVVAAVLGPLVAAWGVGETEAVQALLRSCTTVTDNGYLNWWGGASWQHTVLHWWLPFAVAIAPHARRRRELLALAALIFVSAVLVFESSANSEAFCGMAAFAIPLHAGGAVWRLRRARTTDAGRATTGNAQPTTPRLRRGRRECGGSRRVDTSS